MATCSHAQAKPKPGCSMAELVNPVRRRGQVKGNIAKNIFEAVGTAVVLACDCNKTTGSGAGQKDGRGKKAPTTAVVGAKKN